MTAWGWRDRGEGGFTLIELMISVAILGLLMGGLLGLLTASRDAYSRGSSTLDAQQSTRLVLERMGKEIREAGYHPRPPDTVPATCPPGALPASGGLYPTGGGKDSPCWTFYPIITQSATALTLQYDWNGDGVITTNALVNDPVNCPTGAGCRGERVTYSLLNGTLNRQEVGDPAGVQAVAIGISALAFTYLKADNSTATIPEQIRSVKIAITAKTATMTDQIRLRTR